MRCGEAWGSQGLGITTCHPQPCPQPGLSFFILTFPIVTSFPVLFSLSKLGLSELQIHFQIVFHIVLSHWTVSPVSPIMRAWQSGLQKVASGQTQISWTNFDQNHIYFVQALHGKCSKRYLTQTEIVHDRHKTAFLVYKGLNEVF